MIRQPLLIPFLRNDEEAYQSVEPWEFSGHGRETIPAGTVVDGASVPRIAWTFMPPDGLHRAAAFAHDWCYALKGHLTNGITITRKQADSLFYSLMVDAGVSKSRAAIAYRTVRLGGWAAWKRSAGKPVILPVILRAASFPDEPKIGPRHIYDYA